VNYRVEVSGAARHDIGNIYAYLREHTPNHADRWLVGLYLAMGTLSELPHRCPVAPESEVAGGTARAPLYRDYRVVYEVIGRRVDVLLVRHSSLRPQTEP